ncbi:MAG: hypothetical protein EOP02_23385 [Proteobacteria bacterium]|nr:MAG: hypothetical protein EOP02_23385 [Pseudomonadota bacterium]
MRDLVDKEALRATLKQKQLDAADGAPLAISIQPQDRRVQARRRLAERSNSVAARVLQDLGLTMIGREVGRAVKEVAGRDNRSASIELVHKHVNDSLGINKKQRSSISLEQAEKALAELDAIGDEVVAAIRKGRAD